MDTELMIRRRANLKNESSFKEATKKVLIKMIYKNHGISIGDIIHCPFYFPLGIDPLAKRRFDLNVLIDIVLLPVDRSNTGYGVFLRNLNLRTKVINLFRLEIHMGSCFINLSDEPGYFSEECMDIIFKCFESCISLAE